MLHMKTTLRIGTRGSELALKQTEMAIEAIKAHNPQVEAEIVIIKTDGDTHTDIPLCKVNKTAGTQDKGVFVAAIERALAAGEIDCAVHSLKDMPGQPDPAFEISAVLPREDIWDALILKKGADTAHLTLGTASVRREQLIRTYWSGTAKTVSIRGNVHTRLRKLIESDELDGIVLARAGLNRLGLTGDSITIDGTTLSVVDMSKDSFMPALCQGAIAIETRKGDTATRALIAPANDHDTELCVRAERAFLAMLQADCSVPVAGYATLNGDFMMMRTIYFMPNGMPVRVTHRGETDKPEEVAAGAYAKLQAAISPDK
ncbi:MAG: hydroxymethylbilane synthase [Akkermansiaceae bacterium]|nr:hydroxymethylbilane synthase [Akkermansiaceae bacterium]